MKIDLIPLEDGDWDVEISDADYAKKVMENDVDAPE